MPYNETYTNRFTYIPWYYDLTTTTASTTTTAATYVHQDWAYYNNDIWDTVAWKDPYISDDFEPIVSDSDISELFEGVW